MPRRRTTIRPLETIISRLRGPSGCPWDKRQTHQSLRRFLIEEAYELVEAIDSRDPQRMQEECGDVLLQILLHAQIAKEHGQFTLGDIFETLSAKLIRRHPHVFGKRKIKTVRGVIASWEKTKAQEKLTSSGTSIFDHLPSLPALQQAEKIQRRAARVGFDWPTPGGAVDKILEETGELRISLRQRRRKAIEDEVGDILFSVVNAARKLGIDAETALRSTNQKFVQRFRRMEKHLQYLGKNIHKQTLAELENLWQASKK